MKILGYLSAVTVLLLRNTVREIKYNLLDRRKKMARVGIANAYG